MALSKTQSAAPSQLNLPIKQHSTQRTHSPLSGIGPVFLPQLRNTTDIERSGVSDPVATSQRRIRIMFARKLSSLAEVSREFRHETGTRFFGIGSGLVSQNRGRL